MRLILPGADKSGLEDLGEQIYAKSNVQSRRKSFEMPKWDYTYTDYGDEERPNRSWYSLECDCERMLYYLDGLEYWQPRIVVSLESHSRQ